MSTAYQNSFAERALADIDQILNNFDHGGQIETALPLLLRCRRALVHLRTKLGDGAPEDDDTTWAADLVIVFTKFGGRISHPRLYREMKELRTAARRSWPVHAEDAIRQTLQAYNAECPQYRGGADLFRKIRRGLWRLKDSKIH